MQRWLSDDVADLAPFRVFFPFDMGKCPQKIEKFKLLRKKSQHSVSHNPHFGFVVSSYDGVQAKETYLRKLTCSLYLAKNW